MSVNLSSRSDRLVSGAESAAPVDFENYFAPFSRLVWFENPDDPRSGRWKTPCWSYATSTRAANALETAETKEAAPGDRAASSRYALIDAAALS